MQTDGQARRRGVSETRAEGYPGTGYGSISRGCGIGGTSEHKEGRAWDWGVNAGKVSQRRAAESLFGWLFKEDPYGNSYAMARRLGNMYLIFNRKIWFREAAGASTASRSPGVAYRPATVAYVILTPITCTSVSPGTGR